jgi:ABC-2 type transport system permease protein
MAMSKLLTITQREVGSYFASPIFWVVAAGFLAFYGLVFAGYVGQPQAVQASMRPLLQLIGTILLFVTPILSMKLLSEEQRSGTLELLMTSPVHDWQVVVGKWLSAMIALTLMMALTLVHVLVMLRMATSGMDFGPLLTSYLGILLLGAALLALGTLTSSLTENQVVAAFLGIMLVMVLWFLPFLAEVPGADSAVGKAMSYAGLSEHYLNFGQGLLDSRDVVYFVTLTVGALYIAARALETRRWR